jgi:hypothetical protein
LKGVEKIKIERKNMKVYKQNLKTHEENKFDKDLNVRISYNT